MDAPQIRIVRVLNDCATQPISGAGQTLAGNLLARLDAAYQPFAGAWRISMNEPMGVLTVTNILLSGKWGFVMHIAAIDPEGRKVVTAGGELLERYRISRSQRRSVAFDSLRVAKRDRIGNLVADHG